MEEFLTAVANYGFPIIVSAYLLIRMEQKLDTLERAITELNHTIERLIQ